MEVTTNLPQLINGEQTNETWFTWIKAVMDFITEIWTNIFSISILGISFGSIIIASITIGFGIMIFKSAAGISGTTSTSKNNNVHISNNRKGDTR